MKKLLLLLLLPFLSANAAIYTVSVENNFYAPSELSIELGDTVRFEWVEGNHPTVSGMSGENDMSFDAFPMNSGSTSHDLILSSVGTYPYFCASHWASDNMVGVINVGALPSPEACEDLFISEYVEGSSFNKALELYNPTEASIDLSQYILKRYNNGSLDVSYTDTLSGSIAPGGTFVIVDEDADSALDELGNAVSNITAINGDDAVELYHGVNVIDRIGVVGEDPGTEWPVGSGSTLNNTLVRKNYVQKGQLDWSIGATEWDVFPSDDFGNLGEHLILPCSGTIVPIVSFVASNYTVDENAGEILVQLLLVNANDLDTEVAVEAIEGTASMADYTFSTSTYTLNADITSVEIAIPVTNDDEMESDETFELMLQVISNGQVGTATATITIDDDDTPTPELSISAATEVNEEGVVINDGTEAILTGVTHGVNLNATGLQFTLIDETGGIQVFSFDPVTGYSFEEGDLLRITGVIGQYSGQSQFTPLDILVLSSGNELVEPATVTALGEETESEHILLECVSIEDASGWDGAGTGDNVTITDGTNSFTMRIDDQTNIYGTEAPTGTFTVSGIGGQFDNSTPFDEGYQFFPMYLSAFDFSVAPIADISLIQESADTYTFSATPGLDNYEWDFGDGNSGSGQTVEHTYVGNGNFTVTLSYEGEGSCTNEGSSSVAIDIDLTGLADYESQNLKLSPNPANGFVNLQSEEPLDFVRILNLEGKLLKEIELLETTSIQIDISELSSGFYFIQSFTEGQLLGAKKLLIN